MTTDQVDSTSASGEGPSHDDSAASSAGGAGDVTSPPPPALPAPPKIDPPKQSDEMAELFREQNKLLKNIADTSADTNKRTRELHEGILTEEDDAVDAGGQAGDEVTIVEPAPPPQPHVVGDSTEPGKPTKKGWKKFY